MSLTAAATVTESMVKVLNVLRCSKTSLDEREGGRRDGKVKPSVVNILGQLLGEPYIKISVITLRWSRKQKEGKRQLQHQQQQQQLLVNKGHLK